MTGRDFVNRFYQPLGHLKCGLSSDELWQYARLQALEVAEMIVAEEPMYTGNLNPKWKKWTEIRDEIIRIGANGQVYGPRFVAYTRRCAKCFS